jgi:hypothetical protein
MKNILTVVSAIATTTTALAFSTGLFAPSASAFSLVKNSSGEVDQILNLEVDGLFYDVSFHFDSYSSLYRGLFDFTSEEDASLAGLSVLEALGDTEYTWMLIASAAYVYSDSFSIPYGFSQDGRVLTVSDLGDPRVFHRYGQSWGTDVLGIRVREMDEGVYSTIPYAKFSAASAATSVPEPSLILGFITLGGVLLGSKKQNKG